MSVRGNVFFSHLDLTLGVHQVRKVLQQEPSEELKRTTDKTIAIIDVDLNTVRFLFPLGNVIILLFKPQVLKEFYFSVSGLISGHRFALV